VSYTLAFALQLRKKHGKTSVSFRGCRKITRDREAWKLILKEDKVLHGLQNQQRGSSVMGRLINGKDLQGTVLRLIRQ
jgi:hypothetical protein